MTVELFACLKNDEFIYLTVKVFNLAYLILCLSWFIYLYTNTQYNNLIGTN